MKKNVIAGLISAVLVVPNGLEASEAFHTDSTQVQDSTADYHLVKQLFDKRFPNTPKVIVLATVCRPGWLIEMEGIAIVENEEAEYSNY